jgi:hypothetical protein
MGLLRNLKDKIFGQTTQTPQKRETDGTSPLNLKRFEEDAVNMQGNHPGADSREEKKVHELGNILQEKTEKLGEKILEKGNEWKEKATVFGEYINDKMEDLMQKAAAEAPKESKKSESFFEKAHRKGKEYDDRANDTQRTFQDSLKEAKKSMLTDDFFAKAAKYAKNEYGGNQSKPTILPKDATQQSPADKKNHDTDDLIEDAIIEK